MCEDARAYANLAHARRVEKLQVESPPRAKTLCGVRDFRRGISLLSLGGSRIQADERRRKIVGGRRIAQARFRPSACHQSAIQDRQAWHWKDARETRRRCPEPNTKTFAEIELACMPTANHRFPVRRSVRHQNKPTSITPPDRVCFHQDCPGAPVRSQWTAAEQRARSRRPGSVRIADIRGT